MKSPLTHGLESFRRTLKLPEDLDAFLKKEILREAEISVSERESKKLLQVRGSINFSNETCVTNIYHTAIFPSPHRGLGEEGETIWDITALQCKQDHAKDKCPVIAPKSDYYLGYDNAKDCPFDRSQRDLIDHGVAQPYANPAKKQYFLYLVVEMKSDAAGGNLAKAELQAATAGTVCIKGLRWMLIVAKMPKSLEAVESTIAFSVCMNHRLVALYVHWYKGGNNPQYCMSIVKEFVTSDISHVRRCATTLENIHGWAMGRRKDMIMFMLDKLVQDPPYWMMPSRKRPGSPTDQSKPIQPNQITVIAKIRDKHLSAQVRCI